MRRALAFAGLMSVATFTAPSAAFAMGNANTGQPNQSCQTVLSTGGHTPGNTSSSPGSPFDEAGFGTAPNGGTGGTAYSNGNAHSPNTTNAVSQYDVACAQVSSH